ncbi:MAG: sigma-70 family RNA polymerase sigma factor [Winogradskyella sp.]|uniref:sigma-70 family RNA polymerase sigma factor n=1 Tax=Winogradskyella sp. TaxID=1883156 RepID=UPI0025F8352F|nr:sigma-70 family RNA polymerase sigma factor [Winogradskyella sp.]NRB82352.1 sigma-70 family RNA polymerase sigma factor [Winogradskyella sp.]
MTTKNAWDTYSADIKHFILSKVKNEALADDILQDTFIKVHTKLHTLKENSKLKPWLFSVARYTILDYFRSLSQDIDLDIPNQDVDDNEDDSSHTEKDCLRGILINLPKKYRDPIFLFDIMGLKQKDIATRLELPLPTIKSQIQRGRKLIAQGFMDCCGYKMNQEGYLIGELQDKEDCKICN